MKIYCITTTTHVVDKSEITKNDVAFNHGSITNINGDYYEVAITEHMLVGKTE